MANNQKSRLYAMLFVDECFEEGLDPTTYKCRDGYSLQKHVINDKYLYKTGDIN